MRKPQIWLVGQCGRGEFDAAIAWLREQTQLSSFATIDDALRQEAFQDPDGIVLAASRPGVFQKADIEQLHRRAPLARLVALLGSWCEGEVRSGRPLPGVTRIYAHQWQARLPRELLGTGFGGKSNWRSRVASEVDRLVSSSSPISKAAHRLIGILAARRLNFEGLAAACDDLGHQAIWLIPELPPPLRRVDLLLCDTSIKISAELPSISEVRARLHDPPTILLMDFPRQLDVDLAAQAGVAAVLARPFLLADLATHLEWLVAAPDASKSAAA